MFKFHSAVNCRSSSAINADEKIRPEALDSRRNSPDKRIFPALLRLNLTPQVEKNYKGKRCLSGSGRVKAASSCWIVDFFPPTMSTVVCCNQMLLTTISIHPIRG